MHEANRLIRAAWSQHALRDESVAHAHRFSIEIFKGGAGIRAYAREFEGRIPAPMQHPDVSPEFKSASRRLLFVGMNPSLAAVWSVVRNFPVLLMPPGLDDARSFLDDPRRINELIAFEAAIRDPSNQILPAQAELYKPAYYRKYYGRVESVAREVRASWAVADIFADRRTRQTDLRGLLWNDDYSLTSFGAAQFSAFEVLFKSIRPSVVIISNKEVVRILAAIGHIDGAAIKNGLKEGLMLFGVPALCAGSLTSRSMNPGSVPRARFIEALVKRFVASPL